MANRLILGARTGGPGFDHGPLLANSWYAAHFGEILQVRMLSTLVFDIVNAGADARAEGLEKRRYLSFKMFEIVPSEVNISRLNRS
jgi:hypothetical protein